MWSPSRKDGPITIARIDLTDNAEKTHQRVVLS